MRKKFDKEFKKKAVELSYARGNASEIADELGIDRALLYRWRKEFSQYKDNSFPGHGTINEIISERFKYPLFRTL